MKSMLKGFVVFCIVHFITTVVSDVPTKGDLKLVLSVFRHGDRSPIEPYPRDEYQTWPNGLGELTEIGKNNAFDLGKFFRKRYGAALNLSPEYKKASPEFQIRSTAVHRAQMSAKYFVAGFYHGEIAEVNDEVNKLIDTYDIPYKPESEDHILSMSSCPKQDEMLKSWKTTSTTYKKFISANKRLMSTVSRMAGIEDKDVGEETFGRLVDAVYCEVKHNKTQPDTIRMNFQSLMNWFNESRKFSTPTTDIKRLATGPLLYTMLDYIHYDVVNKDDRNKMILYSAHDSNVMNLLSGMGCFNNIQPPYSSAVILEVRQVEKMYYIHVLYHNDTHHEPYPMKVPGCKEDERCSLSEFVREMRAVKISPASRKRLCGPILKSPSFTLSDNVIPITVGVVLLVCLCLSTIMFRMYRRRRRPRADPMMYKPLAYGDDDDEDV